MSKRITPSQANEKLKNSAKTPIRHHRVSGKKTEKSTEMVLNAAGKTRKMFNSSVVDIQTNGTDLNKYVFDNGMLPATTVADTLRFGAGCYWARTGEHIKYVNKNTSEEAPFDIEFEPMGVEASEVPLSAMDKIGMSPSTELAPLFEETIRITPHGSSPAYENTDPIGAFQTLLFGGTLNGTNVPAALKKDLYFEDYTFSLSSPYSLRDIESFTSSTNTMYASVKPTYNFYVPEYESATADPNNTMPEAVLPSMYVMLTEMTKEPEEEKNEWFEKHITLFGNLRLEAKNEMLRPPSERTKWDLSDKKNMNVQYFDMYGRQVTGALSDSQMSSLGSKFHNMFVSHNNVDLLKDFNSRKELFPMFVDIEFSTDITTEFASALKDSGMGASLMSGISSLSNNLPTRSFVEETVTAVQVASKPLGANEVITQSELTESSRRFFDVGPWYEQFKSGEIQGTIFDQPGSVFLGKQDPELEVSNDPKYDLYKSLMSVVFSSKVRDLVRLRTRSYKEIMNGKLAATETVMYRIEKKIGTEVLQNFWLPNSNEIDVHRFVDTQVKYGRNYTYTIYAYELVFGSKYAYKSAWQEGTEAGCTVITEPSLKIIEVPYFSYQNRLLDSPPVMPDVEIIPFRGVSDKIKLNFSGNVGRYDLMPQIISKSENRVNETIRQAQDRLPTDPIRYESDDHATEFQVFRCSAHPYSYQDFDGKKVKSVYSDINPETQASATSASYVDDIEPNKKYWYTFRSVDNHGHISYPSPIYEVELVDDHGSVYPVIKVVDFAARTPKDATKQLKRMMQIVPTYAQGILNEEKSGLTNVGSVANLWNEDTFYLGVEDETLWGKKFKVRLTSRSTGKKIDINIVFEHRHLKIQPE